jgi:hypothetical protein
MAKIVKKFKCLLFINYYLSCYKTLKLFYIFFIIHVHSVKFTYLKIYIFVLNFLSKKVIILVTKLIYYRRDLL